MNYHDYLDKFAVIGRCLYAEGWANNFQPELSYDGARLKADLQIVSRPDLIPSFGPDAMNWGFVLIALIPQDEIDRTKFTLKFSEGLTMEDPSRGFSNPGDTPFHAMVDRFRGEVAERAGSMLEIGS